MASQVPYSGVPTVQPQFQATPQVNVSSPEAAFGGASARALEHFGQVTEHVGDELFARANSLQILDQQMDAANANSKFAEQSGARLEKFRELQGKDPKEALPGLYDDIDKMRADIGSTLTSPIAQRTYLQESRSMQSRLVISAGAHAGDQFKNYVKGTTQAEIDTSKSNISLHSEDDNVFRDELTKINSKSDLMKDLMGESDQWRDNFRNTATSEAVFERARTLAQKGNVQKANTILKQASDDGLISGDMAGKASAYIRTQRNNITSRVESASFLAGEGGHFGEGKVSPDRLLDGITSVESGGNYNPPHPTVTKGEYAGQHALGRYGVMQGNLQPWLKEAGMPTMTEAEFLRDHKAQDDLAKFKLSQYQDKYGSANKAAMAWFTGSPDPDPTVDDGHTTAAGYLKKFNSGLAQTASTNEVIDLSQKRAQQIIPDDDEFHQVFKDRVEAQHTKNLQVQRQEEVDRKNIVVGAIQPGPDGKLVTSIDEITDPKVHEAWNALSETDRARYNAVLARNAKGDYAPTQENQQSFRQWWGRLSDPMASDTDRKKALEADFTSMSMPWSDRVKLIEAQKKGFTQLDKNPVLTGALRDLAPMMEAAGATAKRSPEDYHQFIGVLDTAIHARMEETGKPLKQEEIRTLGAQALRQISHPWMFGLFSGEAPAFKEEVPEATKNQIIQKHQELKGFAPDEATIQQIWAASQLNEFYSKSKPQPSPGLGVGIRREAQR